MLCFTFLLIAFMIAVITITTIYISFQILW